MITTNYSTKYSDTILSKLFWSLFPTQFLAIVVSNLGCVINGLVVGNYLSSEALAALGFVSPINSIVGAISMIASSGGRVLCGKYMGKNEPKKIDVVFNTAMIILLIIGVVLSAVGIFAAPAIATAVGASGDLNEITADYIRGLATGFIPAMLMPTMLTFLHMLGDSVFATASVGVQAGATLVFSLISANVFGNTFSMGIATAAAEYVMIILLGIRYIAKKNLPKFKITEFSATDAKKLITLGMPGALGNIFYAARNLIMNAIALEIGGSVLVSALAIFYSVNSLTDPFAIAFGAVVAMVGSVIIGERDTYSLKKFFRISMTLGVIIMGSKLIVMIILSGPLSALFGATGEVYDICRTILPIYNTSPLVAVLSYTLLAVYQSFGKIKYCNIIYAFTALIFPVSFMLIFGKSMGIAAIYWSFTVTEIATALIYIVVCWVKYKHIPTTASEFMLIPPDFENNNRFSTSVRSIDDVVTISEKLSEFCLSNGIDARRSNLCGLCAEEMAVNIVEHGFTKGKRKDYTIDIFAICEGDSVMLRLRDNCPVKFDPRTRLAPFDPNDPTKAIGIRMVYSIAKDVTYQAVFNMNILHITL